MAILSVNQKGGGDVNMDKKGFRIGELAQNFEISKRLLRYYDSIGLLQPSFKDENGYRYYNQLDSQKLEQILLLQMLDFSLQEIKELFNDGNIQEEILVLDEFISNKIEYFSQIKENIKKIKRYPKKDLSDITKDIKQLYSVISEQFHEGIDIIADAECANHHDKLIKLLRELLNDSGGKEPVYEEILDFLPNLSSSQFSAQFFMLLRLSKSNRFKLNEIDKIEKKMIKFRVSLDSDIM